FMAMLAVVGMPPFALFQSEFLIVRATYGGGHYAATVLFILFGAAIFAGALLHVGCLVLGPAVAGGGRIELRPWRDYSMLTLAAVLVVIGFWLPAPLLELIRGAAHVVSGD